MFFEIGTSQRCRVAVYDVAGRLTKTLLDADLPAGRGGARWDGRDERGRAMGSGLYSRLVEGANGDRAVRTMILLK
jgi:hypothetical protein